MVAVVQVRPDRHHWVAPKDLFCPGSVSAYVPELHSIVGIGGAQGSGAASAPPHLWRYDLHTLQPSKALIPQGIRQGPQDRFATCYCRHRRALFCVGGKPPGVRQRRSAKQQGNTKAYLIHLDRLGGQSEGNARVCGRNEGGVVGRIRREPPTELEDEPEGGRCYHECTASEMKQVPTMLNNDRLNLPIPHVLAGEDTESRIQLERLCVRWERLSVRYQELRGELSRFRDRYYGVMGPILVELDGLELHLLKLDAVREILQRVPGNV